MPINQYHNNAIVIGLTGSIGSGKSTVANFFAEWGSQIVDFDKIARDLLTKDSETITQVIRLFGPQILRPDQSIDRFALRSLIFKDAQAKNALESLLHPLIRINAQIEIKSFLERRFSLIVAVIPLLFENTTKYKDLACSVVVTSSKELCIQRASTRDSCEHKLIESIYDSQLPQESKIKLADYWIENNSDLISLRVNSLKVFNAINSRFRLI